MTDSNRCADYSGYAPWVCAMLDEYARAIRDLEAVVGAIRPEQYLMSTELSDEEFPDIRAIMEHVVGAGNRYVDYIESALDGTDVTRREHAYAYDTPSAALASLWHAYERMIRVLARTVGRTDDELAQLEVLTRWKQNYDIEQMLEHAIVHILRHRRQIERWLAAGSDG
ncbi:MAG TPA: DinB family protein [Acidobacteriota bacterium]|nr:DinB family protein [Acidobacteriota bacterium]